MLRRETLEEQRGHHRHLNTAGPRAEPVALYLDASHDHIRGILDDWRGSRDRACADLASIVHGASHKPPIMSRVGLLAVSSSSRSAAVDPRSVVLMSANFPSFGTRPKASVMRGQTWSFETPRESSHHHLSCNVKLETSLPLHGRSRRPRRLEFGLLETQGHCVPRSDARTGLLMLSKLSLRTILEVGLLHSRHWICRSQKAIAEAAMASPSLQHCFPQLKRDPDSQVKETCDVENVVCKPG